MFTYQKIFEAKKPLPKCFKKATEKLLQLSCFLLKFEVQALV